MRHRRATLQAVGLLIAAQSLVACAGPAPPIASAPGERATQPASPSPRFTALPTARPAARSTGTPSPGPYDGVPIVVVEAKVFAVPGSDIGYLGVSARSVWAATINGLVRIDPGTLKAKLVDHGEHFGIAVTRDALWTTDPERGTANRFDPVKGTQTATAEVIGYPEAVAILEDSVWVAQHRRGSVTRLGEPSAKVITLVEVGPAGAGGPHGITATKDGVWVGITNNHSIVRIDPSSNAVVATIETKTSPCGGIAVQPDAVWVSSCYDDHFAVRVDPRTNRNVAEIDIGGHNGGAVVVDGYPWFPVANRLVRIDPATNRIDRIVEFAKAGFDGYGTVIGFDSVWVGDFNGSVAKIPIALLEN